MTHSNMTPVGHRETMLQLPSCSHDAEDLLDAGAGAADENLISHQN